MRTRRFLAALALASIGMQAHAGTPAAGSLLVSPGGNPINVTFPNQAVGTTSAADSRSLTATIVGGDAGSRVQIESIAISPSGDFVKGPGCDPGTQLAHGGSCNFDTIFAPSAEGSRAAALSISCSVMSLATNVTINCNNTPTLAISFDGIGIAAVLPQIPALGQYATTALALFMLGFAALRLRRR